MLARILIVVKCWEDGLVLHDINKEKNCIGVVASNFKAGAAQAAILSEQRRLHAVHNINHLLGEFPGRGFEGEALSRRDAKHESEVDVNHVTVTVDHDVSVVAIFDGEQVADDAVTRHTAHEFHLGIL